MENLLLGIMEFAIELIVVSAPIALFVVGLSIGILYATSLYKNKGAAIITPIIIAIAFGATQNHVDIGQWAYYAIPAMIFAPPFVYIYCYRKRLKEKGYQSTIR